MNLEKLRELFQRMDAQYEVLKHPLAYTAQEEAAAAHVPGHMFCKTVIAYTDHQPMMLVLPAPHMVDFERVRGHLGVADLRLATEAEVAALFPDCDAGAMPPFACHGGMQVYLDEELAAQPEIVFEAGLHNQAVLMPMADYRRIASPQVFSFGIERSAGDDIDREAVARRAYELYAQRGREDGHALEDWLAAEAEVRRGRTRAKAAASTG
jgi:Ala-tRNA(Pro) deacylase